MVAFAVVVDKQAVSPDDPVERAFEQICNRFNLFLARQWHRKGKKHRGLVVMDKTHYEETLQGLAIGSSERDDRPLACTMCAERQRPG